MTKHKSKKKFKTPTPRIKGKKCIVCGKPVVTNRYKYCKTCSHFFKRMDFDGYSPSQIQDIKAQVHERGYVCGYTEVDLEMNDMHSPWYRAIDHWIPGDGRKMVLTCALVNTMKADMLEKEFWYNVKQLYNHHFKGKKFKKKKLVYWYRLIAQYKGKRKNGPKKGFDRS